MKKISITIALVICWCLCNAQMTIDVSYDKSVMLVFRHALKEKGWNCGDKEMVGVAVNSNKVLIQAKEPDFYETNLIIELVDGSFYAFNLIYNNTPSKFFYTSEELQPLYESGSTDISQTTSEPVLINSVTEKPNSNSVQEKEAKPLTEIEIYTKGVDQSENYIKRIGVRDKKLLLYIGGIWILNNKLYFKVNIKNESTISYEINYGEFLSKTITKGVKGQSAQADRKKIVAIYNTKTGLVLNDEQDNIYQRNFGVIEGKMTESFVYVLDKFTISDNKSLYVNFWERNGDRNVELQIESVELLIAKDTLL